MTIKKFLEKYHIEKKVNASSLGHQIIVAVEISATELSRLNDQGST